MVVVTSDFMNRKSVYKKPAASVLKVERECSPWIRDCVRGVV